MIFPVVAAVTDGPIKTVLAGLQLFKKNNKNNNRNVLCIKAPIYDSLINLTHSEVDNSIISRCTVDIFFYFLLIKKIKFFDHTPQLFQFFGVIYQ